MFQLESVTKVSCAKEKSKKRFKLIIIASVVSLVVILTTVSLATYYGLMGAATLDLNMCRVRRCGQSGANFLNSRIIGGRYAREGEFAFHAAISRINGTHPFCGGSLINDRWILTAGHCVVNENVRDIRVSVGITNVAEMQENSIEIENYWLFPEYTKDENFFDIALIKTKVSVEENSHNFVSPICLPYDGIDSPNVTRVKASGFGYTDQGVDRSRLRTASLNIVSTSICKETFPGWYDDINDEKLIICAGDLKGGQDTCYGDSGGPLLITNENGSYVLKGITSFGYGCGRKNTPGVYTKVSAYMDWTCETMVSNGLN